MILTLLMNTDGDILCSVPYLKLDIRMITSGFRPWGKGPQRENAIVLTSCQHDFTIVDVNLDSLPSRVCQFPFSEVNLPPML